MNCLLLLIILFCCNSNGSYNVGNCSREGFGGRNRNVREECDGRNQQRECECKTPNVHTHTPPPMPRTQFPYLDVEPRTCGCEEKSNS